MRKQNQQRFEMESYDQAMMGFEIEKNQRRQKRNRKMEDKKNRRNKWN